MYQFESKWSPRMIEKSLDHAIEWAQTIADNAPEKWFATDDGALQILSELYVELKEGRKND